MAVKLSRERAALFGLLALAAALRAPGLWTELWLDEVWNVNIARGFGYFDILLKVPYDANHVLNTLWLRAVGDPGWWGLFRLHSFAAGVGAVALAGVLAGRWGRLQGLLAAGVAASSYPLALYSSEARGHALMVFFALAAFGCLRRRLETGSRLAYAGWAASLWLGWLSHLMFAQAYAALGLWSLRRLWRREKRRAAALGDWLLLHLPGLAACAFVYFVQVRHLRHAGGPELEASGVLREALAMATGAPDGPWAWAAGAVALGAALWALRDLAKRGDDEWVLFGALVVGAPAALLALHPAGLLYPRYFLLTAAFGSMLWARAAAAALGRKGGVAAAAGLLLAAYAAGSAARFREFARHGRGRYFEALESIAYASGGETTVGSGHDFAHRMMVEFYAPRVPGSRLRYLGRADWTKDRPDWAIAHQAPGGAAPQPVLIAHTGARYEYAGEFRSSPHVGVDWFVYRRAARP